MTLDMDIILELEFSPRVVRSYNIFAGRCKTSQNRNRKFWRKLICFKNVYIFFFFFVFRVPIFKLLVTLDRRPSIIGRFNSLCNEMNRRWIVKIRFRRYLNNEWRTRHEIKESIINMYYMNIMTKIKRTFRVKNSRNNNRKKKKKLCV